MRKKRFIFLICVLLVSFMIFLLKVNSRRENNIEEESTIKPQRTLIIAIWSKWITKDILRKFEKKHNCRIIQEFAASASEFVSKLRAKGSTSRIDLIMLSREIATDLIEIGSIKPIDIRKVKRICGSKEHPSLYNLDGEPYAISYTISGSKLIYNIEALNSSGISVEDLRTLSIFEDKRMSKRFSFLDDYREVIGYALLKEGLSPNTKSAEDLLKASSFLKNLRKNVVSLDSDLIMSDVVQGNIICCVDDINNIRSLIKNGNIGWMSFDEGSITYSNDIMISSSSTNEDLTYAFINFMLEEDNVTNVCKRTLESSYFADVSCSRDSRVNDNVEVISPLDKETNKLYIDLWLSFKHNSFNK
ncbi:MAG: extracellular solute-binding protein [Chlamydiia bacterium]|nr:extracellular solute-binding protein [Chlamydiia bacterium]